MYFPTSVFNQEKNTEFCRVTLQLSYVHYCNQIIQNVHLSLFCRFTKGDLTKLYFFHHLCSNTEKKGISNYYNKFSAYSDCSSLDFFN